MRLQQGNRASWRARGGADPRGDHKSPAGNVLVSSSGPRSRPCFWDPFFGGRTHRFAVGLAGQSLRGRCDGARYRSGRALYLNGGRRQPARRSLADRPLLGHLGWKKLVLLFAIKRGLIVYVRACRFRPLISSPAGSTAGSAQPQRKPGRRRVAPPAVNRGGVPRVTCCSPGVSLGMGGGDGKNRVTSAIRLEPRGFRPHRKGVRGSRLIGEVGSSRARTCCAGVTAAEHWRS